MNFANLLEAKDEPFVVKMEKDSEEDDDDEDQFHVANKNPEQLLGATEKEKMVELIRSELGCRSKTIFQECKDTVRLAGKATIDLEIKLEMAKDDHVIENHFDNKTPASYKGLLTKKESAGTNHCTENHFFKKLPPWVVKQLQVHGLKHVLYKFNSPADLSLAKLEPFGSIAVAFLISQIGLYDVVGPEMFVSGFNQLYRRFFTSPPGAAEETLPLNHPARGFNCLTLDVNGEVEFLKGKNRHSLYKSQCFNFIAQLPDSSDSDESD